MNYYSQVKNYFDNPPEAGIVPPGNLNYGTVNTFNSINIPYGDTLLPSNALNRQGNPGVGTFGKNYVGGQSVLPMNVIGAQNTAAVKKANSYFLNAQQNPQGVPQYTNPIDNYSNTTLQAPRNTQGYLESENKIYSTVPDGSNASYITSSPNTSSPNTSSPNTSSPNKGAVSNKSNDTTAKDYYVYRASQSLHQNPDPLMSVFFSDDNINHLLNTVVQKVQQITADSGVAGDKNGITIQTPHMDDFFYYMVNIFQNYKIHNGSICFVNLKNNSNLKSDIAKLNTNVLQEYVSKLISQINMYIYYYKDASQLPEQLSLPTYTAMKGSRSLEYNVAFQSGNSIGVASYNQVGNIF